MTAPVSLCVHSYNEASALRRLIASSLPFADLLHEWVVVDHRSDDGTPAVMDELREMCSEHGIGFVGARESCDFSPGFLFADLRGQTAGRCSAPVVGVMDADYILGPAFRGVLKKAVRVLTAKGSTYYGVAYSRPVVWDHLTTDAQGVVTDHGRVWLHAIHKGRVELHASGSVEYRQHGKGGMWERPFPITTRRRKVYRLTKKRSIQGVENAIISANVKPVDRLALRKTMTTFQRDVLAGTLKGEWLDEYRAGRTSEMGTYAYDDVNLRGWRTNLPNLDLRA